MRFRLTYCSFWQCDFSDSNKCIGTTISSVLGLVCLHFIPRGGGTCEIFDRDARVIFLGLKFMKMSFFGV